MMRPRLGLCLLKIAHSCLACFLACRASTSALLFDAVIVKGYAYAYRLVQVLRP